jgi:magnesium chelatase family protein
MLPPLTLADALKTTRIHSVAELAGTRTAVVATRRFRSQRPSYTSSEVGLIGGGQVPMPSEMLRVHYGRLFLDEWPVCHSHILGFLWQPSRSTTHRAHLLHGVDLASCITR